MIKAIDKQMNIIIIIILKIQMIKIIQYIIIKNIYKFQFHKTIVAT